MSNSRKKIKKHSSHKNTFKKSGMKYFNKLFNFFGVSPEVPQKPLRLICEPTVYVEPTVFTSNLQLSIAVSDYVNQNIANYIHIGKWDVSAVTNMDRLFMDTIITEEQNKKLFSMENGKKIGIQDWDVSNVTSMKSMFEGCTAFNSPLNKWGHSVRNVKDMSYMFAGCTNFNKSLNNWNVTSVIQTDRMFLDCTSFNQPLEKWNLNSINNMQQMFKNCTSYHKLLSLHGWNISPDVSKQEMFLNVPRDSTNTVPNWYIQLSTFPNTIPVDNYYYSSEDFIRKAPVPNITVGNNLVKGIPTTPPQGLSLCNTIDDSKKLIENAHFFYHNSPYSTAENKELVRQYVYIAQCFGEEVDCYVGNRLTTYLLTIHEELQKEYPEYTNPLISRKFDASYPVVYKDRYITLNKIKAILEGFRKLNNYLKHFPTLNKTDYPNGYYVYRGKPYQGECENLVPGQQFVLPMITSTSLCIDTARNFTEDVNTKYEDTNGNIITKELSFVWRVKIPHTIFPVAYLTSGYEKEICLPLGTEMKYLGCHVIESSELLICELEIVGLNKKDVLLDKLYEHIDADYAAGRFDVIAQNMISPEIAKEWDAVLPKRNSDKYAKFGGNRNKRHTLYRKHKMITSSRTRRHRHRP